MKAIIRTVYGNPEVLSIQEKDIPVPKDDELLIRVHASTVNRTDAAILSGSPWIIRLFTGLFKPKQAVPGTDFAGEVLAVGKQVTLFKTGDKVWGFDDQGLCTHAQYFTLPEKQNIAIIPDSFSYEQAAASAEGAHYAYNFINKVKLSEGQKALVNGATGAIGSAMLQFLKFHGLYVTAVCGTPHTELIKSLGADKVIDYFKEDFTKDEEKYDYVFDAVGKSTFGKCKKLLKPQGIYISSELGPGWQNPMLALITPLLPGAKKVKFPLPVNIKESLAFIGNLAQQGKFKPLIDKKYPMEKIAEAYTYVVSGQKIGNVIINFSE